MKENLKKIFAVVMIVAMIAAQMAVPAYAASAPGYCNKCGNNGVIGELLHIVEATCEDGFEIYSCAAKDCTGTITIRVDATGAHTSDENTQEAVPATCTEDGTVAYERCTVCEAYLDPQTHQELSTIVDPATGHNYIPVVTGPDCTNGGYTTYTCDNCQYSYVADRVTCLEHDFSVKHDRVEATCKEPGSTEYYTCSRCEEEDPDRKMEVLPVEDHNLHVVDTKTPDCVNDGYNKFKCDEPTCPYYAGIEEVLKKLGHDKQFHVAKQATCEEGGYAAYYTCKREGCTYSTYDASTEVAALGHTTVSAGYIAPTCTTKGCTDAIICDRCQHIHHPGEEIAPLGHNLITVAEKTATCAKKGNIEHKKCQTCAKLFAATTENTDITATPLTSAQVQTKRSHDYEEIVIAATCDEEGYTVYTCKYDDCRHTYSTTIAAKGHSFEKVEKQNPTCIQTGMQAHNKCTVCELLFAVNADPHNAEAVAESTLVIAALGHKATPVDFVRPTYDAAGNEEGAKCERCNEPMQNAEILEELQEGVKFHYVIEGVDGATNAVNSGYVTLKIYFDVLTAADDKEAYNSDVLANIFAIDYALAYDADAFELTYVEVAPGAFAKAEFTPLAIANENGSVAITQDMITAAKQFRGENNLFATLTFQVATDAAPADYAFTNTKLDVVHPENESVATATSEAEAVIEVKGLGDANADGVFTSHDTMVISNYIMNSDDDTEYVAEFDMDKNGVIDFVDLDLLRKAIVGNNEYLGITVDPNAIVVVPEV